MRRNRLFGIITALLLLALLLCGCSRVKKIAIGEERYPEDLESLTLVLTEEQLPLLDSFPNLRTLDLSGSTCYDAILTWAEAHPEVDVRYTVELLDGLTVDRDVEALDLSDRSAEEIWSVLARRPLLPKLKELALGEERDGLSITAVREILENDSDLELSFRFPLFGKDYSIFDTRLDLSRVTEGQLSRAMECMAAMPNLKRVELGSETREDHLEWEAIARLETAAPDAVYDYDFTLYDEPRNLSDTVLDINHTPVYDDGELVRRVVRCMPQLETLDMDFCGVGNETMDAIRHEFPKVDVIWRIWFGSSYSVRTDVEKILASKPSQGGVVDDYQAQVLKYCTKVKYLDLGHNEALTDLSFIRSMPDLEVLIIAMNPLGDLSPLADCPKLEYIEMFFSNITDLSPLSELHNLRHLNIGMCDYLTSIEPLYGLTDLERLYIGCLTPIPPEQVAHMRELAPNCEINDTYYDTSLGDWRYKPTADLKPAERAWYKRQDYYVEDLSPRFALLRKQFGYDELAYSFLWLDPKYGNYWGYVG